MKCIEIHGNKMFLNSEDILSDLILSNSFEPLETEVITSMIKSGNVVLDIGANIGYYTLIFARLVGREGKVFAFEPDPANFRLLEMNVKANGFDNVVLVQKAVSDMTGKCSLYLCESNKGMHRIYRSRYCKRSIEIESIRLDDLFVHSCDRIDFVKIDAEGSEWAVFQGMPLLLKRCEHLTMMTEFAPYAIKEFGLEPLEYLSLLEDLGFQLYQLDYDGMRIKLADIAALLRMNMDREDITNLLCIR
ncbi:MAG TPA: FkbM family methyltransferase [Blastocatellia bacterium]|jgi:FkbM family methyltransferase